MHVIIIGAGAVGSAIAGSLAAAHEVVVVDIDGERVDSLTYELDVLALEGNGTSLDTLEEAGIEDADLLIASTDDDETNIVACSTAATVTDAFSIARVKNTEYFDTWKRSKRAFGIDFMVCSNLQTAETVVRIIGLPAALDVDPFAKGRVQMAEFEIPEGSQVAEQTVEEADQFESLTFAAVLRNGDVEIPRGKTVLHAGDRIIVIGLPDSVQAFASTLAPDQTAGDAESIVIVGGSDIGFLTAQALERRGLSPRLIERDPERARELAEALPGTTVLESDATDVEFLEREHIDDADLVVAALDSDEKNLLVSLLAKRLGAARTVAIVDDDEYVDLFEAVGVDVAVNPREVTAEEITRFTRDRQAENVALIESDLAEVLEIEVDADSVLCDRTIREAMGDLPVGVVIGAITRGEEYLVPRGDTVVRPDDHVVVFLETTLLEEVTSLL